MNMAVVKRYWEWVQYTRMITTVRGASLISPGFSGGHQQNHIRISMTTLQLVMLAMHNLLYCCILLGIKLLLLLLGVTLLCQYSNYVNVYFVNNFSNLLNITGCFS